MSRNIYIYIYILGMCDSSNGRLVSFIIEGDDFISCEVGIIKLLKTDKMKQNKLWKSLKITYTLEIFKLSNEFPEFLSFRQFDCKE